MNNSLGRELVSLALPLGKSRTKKLVDPNLRNVLNLISRSELTKEERKKLLN